MVIMKCFHLIWSPILIHKLALKTFSKSTDSHISGKWLVFPCSKWSHINFIGPLVHDFSSMYLESFYIVKVTRDYWLSLVLAVVCAETFSAPTV